MERTVVGVFDNPSEVQFVVDDLVGLGFERSKIDIVDQKSSARYATETTGLDTTETKATENKGFFSGLMAWIHDLGFGDNETDYMAENIRRGGTVVAVQADENRLDQISDIMDRHGAIDVDQRFDYYKKSGFTKFDAAAPPYDRDEMIAERERFAPGGQFAIPVVEENVNVGKERRERGHVRILTRVRETPIDKDLSLRNERVEVERRAVDRPVTAADMDSFKEGEMTLTESEEVPVVNKEARVVEEVLVKTDVDERTETIHETARRRDVEVERDNNTTTPRR